jgi:hypothetical protein
MPECSPGFDVYRKVSYRKRKTWGIHPTDLRFRDVVCGVEIGWWRKGSQQFRIAVEFHTSDTAYELRFGSIGIF